jgi:hypothetical protein
MGQSSPKLVPAPAVPCELFRSENLKSLVAISRQNAVRALQLGSMALKPNAGTCRVREQVIEDLPSGLTLQFEACEGGTRLLIAGKVLASGNREIVFDAEGRVIRLGAAGLKKLHL